MPQTARGPVLVVDIGGTKLAAALVLPDVSVCGRRTIPTQAAEGGPAVLARALRLAQDVMADGPPPVAIGVGTAGDVDPNTGVITYATSAIPDWRGAAIRDAFRTALCLPTVVDNDGHVMALGEARHGAGLGCREVVALTVGTGIGGGLVLDGRVYRGAAGLAGAIGHLVVESSSRHRCTCGGLGCLESVAAGPPIVADFLAHVDSVQLAAEFGWSPSEIGVREIAQAASRGNRQARAALRRAARFLGMGIASLLNVLNPGVVVVGGGVAQSPEPYFSEVRRTARAQARPPVRDTPIVPAQLGIDANLIGAADLAWQTLGLSNS